MSIINFSNTRQMEGLLDEISQVKDLIESKINLSRVADREKRVSLTLNKVMRICFIVGLSVTVERKEDDFKDIQLSTWKIQCKLPPKTKRFCPLVLK